MKTDRELLELAANAAGIDGKFVAKGAPGLNDSDGMLCNLPRGRRFFWSPLSDDGDCAHLEATLGIDIEWGEASVVATIRHPRDPDIFASVPFECFGNDRNAARRRVSVQVAADYQISREA